MEYINLRPHHLLCIPGYKGHGYSKEFEANMEKVVNSLNQGTKVKITVGNDDICRSCLNPSSNICHSNFVNKLDSSVMNLLGLSEGDMVDYKETIQGLRAKIDADYHRQICSECIWMKKGLCTDTFS